MKRKGYNNKRPLSTFHPDNRHWTRKGNSWKQKEGYTDEDSAYEFLENNPNLKAKGAVVYQCPICCKWHISIHY